MSFSDSSPDYCSQSIDEMMAEYEEYCNILEPPPPPRNSPTMHKGKNGKLYSTRPGKFLSKPPPLEPLSVRLQKADEFLAKCTPYPGPFTETWEDDACILRDLDDKLDACVERAAQLVTPADSSAPRQLSSDVWRDPDPCVLVGGAARQPRGRGRRRPPRRQRNQRQNGLTYVPMSGRVTAPIERVTLTYTTELFPLPSSGAVFHYVFRGNGAFDPDYTGVGSQPKGFDQQEILYDMYHVLGSKITVRGSDTSATSASSTFYISITPSVHGTDYIGTTPEDCSEAAVSRMKLFSNHQGNQADNVLVLSQRASDVLCPAAGVIGVGSYSAAATTVPSRQWFYHINVQSVDDSTTMVDVQLLVKVEYDIVWFGRHELATS